MLPETSAQTRNARGSFSGPAYAVDKAVHGIMGERWYVIHTQRHAENRVIQHVERQGYRIFCPRIRTTVRHARRETHVLAPLFPNYLFVRLDVAHDRWRSVNGTRGVIRLISQGEVPQPVPHGIVEALQDRLGNDGTIECTPLFKVGQAVQISTGPFA